ncbi:MAG TPA: hypothetical protein VJ948_01300 [Acidimicrobiia bacterium]|nr:hypothetical protein [Acidimicrobiia bacterium]
MLITPRPFGQVLGEAMNSLATVWKTLLVPAVVVSLPMGLLTAAVFVWTGGGDFLELLINNPEGFGTLPNEVFWDLARPFYVAAAFALLLQLLGGVFVALASHRAVAAQITGVVLTGREASAGALRRYPIAIASTLIITLTLVLLVGLGATVWLVPIMSVGVPNSATVLVALLLLVVMLGPGAWAAVSVSMTTPAVALEDTGILGSIRRSMRLVRGRWWATAGFLLLVGLLGGIAVQLIQLVALPLAAAGGGDAALTVASALGVFTQGLLVAAIAGMYTHWYVDLRARQEPLTTADLG